MIYRCEPVTSRIKIYRYIDYICNNYGWVCPNTFHATINHEIIRICSAIDYADKNNLLKLTEPIKSMNSINKPNIDSNTLYRLTVIYSSNNIEEISRFAKIKVCSGGTI